jgi:putative transposase
MPRVARIVVPGVPHHITQRGNNRQDVFFVDDDRRMYLGLLAKSAARYGLQVLGYCLMTNHFHLVAVPRAADSLAKALGRTDFVYTQYIARRHRRSGHLWQNRFYSGKWGHATFFLNGDLGRGGHGQRPRVVEQERVERRPGNGKGDSE